MKIVIPFISKHFYHVVCSNAEQNSGALDRKVTLQHKTICYFFPGGLFGGITAQKFK